MPRVKARAEASPGRGAGHGVGGRVVVVPGLGKARRAGVGKARAARRSVVKVLGERIAQVPVVREVLRFRL